MLHITSFMQKIAKLNNKNTIPTTNGTISSSLNTHLNRNYSFVYDHNLKSYVYDYNQTDENTDQEEQFSYWGYLRDKNADRKLNNNACNNKTKKDSKQTETLNDAYWGIFKDTHLNTDDFEKSSESSSPSNGFSLSSSINSLSRFRDNTLEPDLEHDHKPVSSLSSSYCEQTRLDFDYKTSKFKIQARKRDDYKILIQSLEDKEALFNKETIKSFDSNYLLNLENRKSTSTSSLSSFKYSTKLKDISFLHFSTFQFNNSTNRLNLSKFKNVFNTVSKLNKTINVFNGDFVNDITSKTDIPLLNNVHASLYDLNGLIRNYTKSNDLSKKTTAVSVCSNVFEFNLNNNKETSVCEKVFGNDNHSTMLFEFQNVKIGFMALIDKQMFDKLNKLVQIDTKQTDTVIFSNDYDDDDFKYNDENNTNNNTLIEYVDYLEEANRLSKQLRMCGASIIVCLINMDNEQNEQRLLREANDIDVIFSSYNNSSDSQHSHLNQTTNKIDLKKYYFNNRYLIKTESNYDCLSLVTLRLDEFNSNQIVDISINKYIVD